MSKKIARTCHELYQALHDDYAAAKSRIKELEAERDRSKQIMSNTADKMEELQTERDSWKGMAEQAADKVELQRRGKVICDMEPKLLQAEADRDKLQEKNDKFLAWEVQATELLLECARKLNVCCATHDVSDEWAAELIALIDKATAFLNPKGASDEQV